MSEPVHHYYQTWPTISLGQIGIGALLTIVAILNLANLDKANQVMRRADAIIEDHDIDMEHLKATVQSRNEVFRLLGEKTGVDAKEMDEAIALDTLAVHKPRPKRKRMAAP